MSSARANLSLVPEFKLVLVGAIENLVKAVALIVDCDVAH